MTLQLSRERKLDILEKMMKIRFFERKIEYLFSRGEIYGTTHLYIGQEANAVGVCELLKPGDLASSYHRGHGHAIARGLDIGKLMAEITGKETGYCKGKGGTQHISALSDGFIGTNGITGGLVPISAGAAFSFKLRKIGSVVVSFIGDGAMGEGTVLETLNLASLWKLPLVVYCENNMYAMSTHVSQGISSSPARIAEGFGIPSFAADGNDVLDVMKKASAALEIARSGRGPAFVEALTYRHMGHSKSDMREYRTKDEEQEWMEKCPIKRLSESMLRQGELTPEELSGMESRVSSDVDKAAEFAAGCRELSPDRLYEDL